MVYLATSGFWINLNFVFVSLFSFILSVAFANLLTKESYGTYQYVLSISSFLAAFTFSGFNTTIIQSAARGYEGTFQASIRPQLYWNLIPGCAGIAFGGYYLLVGQITLGLGLICVGAALPILNTYNSYTAYLAGKKEFKTLSLYSIIGNAAYYAAMFIGIFLIPKALPLVAINLFVNAGMSFVLYRRVVNLLKPKGTDDPGARSYAVHLSLMNVLSLISAQIDSIFVFHFLGATELATYSLATLLPERAAGAFKAISTSALPRFAERNADEIRKTLGPRLIFLTVGSLFCCLAYAWIAPSFFHIVYPKYSDAIPYSQIYALTFLNAIGGVVTSALFAHRKVRELYILNTAISGFQILIQFVGIILWGFWGIIIAKVISAIFASASAICLFYIGKRGSAD
jgi:O-antigen/teichoic acid export membrane protein